MKFLFECLACGETTPPSVHRLRCEPCGGLFKVVYDTVPNDTRPRTPATAVDQSLTLGEGSTPVVRLKRAGERLGIERLWAKLEFMAPTGSFKDRGSAVLISAAMDEGVTEFVEDSSGNAGASLSAYAAAAGMTAHVFVPASAAHGKLDQIRIFGAELHAIDGPRQAATEAAERFVSERNLPYLSHNLSPYFSEGMKSVAYEVADSAAANVQHIVLPVGNGSLLIGAKSGFDELVEVGVIGSAPAFHAVQANAVQPIAAAVNDEEWDPAMAKPTVASGIAVSVPPRLEQCVEAVQSSGGSAVAVADDVALGWQRWLAASEGIFCEVTSATAFAGLENLLATGKIRPDEPVLVPITGSGLKEPISS